MALCLNRDGLEYSTLAKMSGIQGFKLDVMVSHYLEKYGRFPKLHELPGSDSSKYLKTAIQAKDKKSTDENYHEIFTTITRLQQYLEIDDTQLDENVINKLLNSKHSDLQINVTLGKKNVNISYRKLPTKYDSVVQENLIFLKNSSTANVRLLNSIIENTLKFSGVSIIPITDAELSTPQWKNVLMGRSTV